ncbi:DUF502 domain-containing protein [Halorussus sp. MSC15.2]|uniref:DUF502 domain-containing protein n=1 Tax=Halorussus sp. MSC15.2 TaxID=2283638 RepID=UPI0013D2E600|nr:DUF502 domain-containing protein [Halorussus sp. MSC15.2]NEU56061.1 DUF502 domain-containing protein [Halorussus sp. MSC15.2]
MGQGESPAGAARDTGESLYDGLLSVVVTGIAVIVPLVVTVWVLATVVEFIAGAFAPLVAVLEWTGAVAFLRSLWLAEFFAGLGIYSAVFEYVPELVAGTILVGSIVAIGSLAHVRYGERLVVAVDSALAEIPGVGTVYKSFRRVGDAMLGSEAENFEDVKVVEYPREGSYILGFETADSPAAISEAVGEDDLVAMFLPFAPNPVMGGYLAHIPEDRVYDVDMTVEEGVRTIITSGIATGEDDDEFAVGNIPGVEHEKDSPAKAD